MRSEMKDGLGQQALEEISRQLVDKISGFEDMFKENFSQMNEKSQQHYEELKNEIAELKAKDDIKKTLGQRESELKEEINF